MVSADPERVRIGISNQILCAPLFIAVEKGYFADEGLDVTVKGYPFGKVAFEAMLSGDVDLATVAETPIVLASFERNDFSIASVFVYNSDDAKVIVRTDRVDGPSGLRGKTIGTTAGTSAQFFLDSYLLYSGTPRREVRVVDMPPGALPAALQRGELDAIAIFEPYAHEALELPQGKAMRLPRVDLFREIFALTAMKTFQGSHPGVLPKVLRAIDRAVSYIREHRSEAIVLVARLVNTDERLVRDTWDDYVFGLSLDQAFLITLEDVARWARANALTDSERIPNYLEFIDAAGLMAANPRAVRIIRWQP